MKNNATIRRVVPGLAALLNYDRRNFFHDLVAGLSVAAVAVPVGVAYAQLAGFNPAVGLYSCFTAACLCHFRNVASGNHRSGPGNVCMGGGGRRSVGYGRREFVFVAFDRARRFYRRSLHRRQLSEIGSASGFPFETNPGRVPEWHRTQHHPRTNRQDFRFSDRVRRSSTAFSN